MARMIPAVIPEDTESEAEKKLFPVLRESLNDTFVVFHSLDLLTRNLRNKFIEGEIDYLIFSQELGLLVLEVKSGIIRYDGSSAAWYQNDHQMVKSPFEQARTAKYQLREFLTRQLGYTPQMAFGHSVCFPDVLQEINNLPPGAEPDICITGNDLPDIGHAIIGIMQTFQKRLPPFKDEKNFERIRQILIPQFEYGVTLGNRIIQDERKLFNLTVDQCRMLDFIHNQKQALIEGCAGSGKTVMAIKKAIELGDAGNSVLLLAYNRLLGEHLADSVKGHPNITASTYHDFCISRLEAAGILPTERKNQQYWEKDIPEAFAVYIEGNPLKFAAVIIDEGQDFRVEYWLTIEEMRNPESYFYIFYDPDQNLFQTEMEFPIKGPPFILKDNCRNTRKIFNKLKTYTRHEMRPMDGSPDGETIREYHGITDRSRRRLLRDILCDLLEVQGLKSADIVVLGGHSIDKTCLAKDSRLGNYTVSEKEEDGPNIIPYHTYMKFKGCEASAVILLDVDAQDERWSPLAMYTAISRAKHLLYIIRKD